MNLNKKELVEKLKHYSCSIILIWLAVLFYRYNRYYSSFLSSETQLVLFYLAIIYTVFGFFSYIVIPVEKTRESKAYVAFSTIKRALKETRHYLTNFTTNPLHPLPKISHNEKTALLFLLVKIFFLPIMLNFLFNNLTSVNNYIQNFTLENVLTFNGFNSYLFPFLISFLFLIDTLYFSFGYSFEHSKLKNKVRSVEPTVLGWAVALVCYPPFNSLFNGYTGWYANDFADFGAGWITFGARIFFILLLGIYVSATIALGAKSSNLTNRGIVTRGPYKYIRHPAYISKNLAWWITVIPVMNIFSFLSMLSWSVIYYLRAITEERHLIKDPDYQEYCKKVKYRFIPGIY
ncbi:MAG: methyltransferase family protein [Candidatus Nanoarchaeia archaeon]